MIVCALLMGYAHTARAQWVVTDPTNLVQNIISATQGTTTATNMIKNLQEGIKIYNQGKAYYDALKTVHNIIKDARKVKLTIEMVSEITDIYVNGFNRMVTDPNFTPETRRDLGRIRTTSGGGRRAGYGFEERRNLRKRTLDVGQGAHGCRGSDLLPDAGVPEPDTLFHEQDDLGVVSAQPCEGRFVACAGSLRKSE